MTFLDTADMYGPFTNEKLVGKAVAGRRERIVLATTFGNERAEDGTRLGIDGRPDYVHRAADASLRRLGVDHLDPTTSTASTRPSRSRRPSGRWRSSSRRARSATSACRRPPPRRSAGPTQCIPSARCRPSTASSPGTSRTRSSPPFVRSGSGSSPTRPSGAASSSERPPPSPTWRTATPGGPPTSRGSRGPPSRATSPSWPGCASWRRRRTPLPDSLRSPGSSRRGRTSCPSPARKRVRYLEEDAGAATLTLDADDLAALERAVPRGAVAGERYGDLSSIDA